MSDLSSESTTERKRLRALFRKRRQAVSAAQRKRDGKAALTQLKASKLLSLATCVGLYVSTSEELDTDPILQHLLQQRIEVGLPAITDRRAGHMEFRLFSAEHPLQMGTLGIQEPAADAPLLAVASMAIMLLPLVAFDQTGTRLGMGGGYYDRVLGRLATDQRPLLIGHAYALQRSDSALPKDVWDIPIDAVLSEQALTACSDRGQQALASCTGGP